MAAITWVLVADGSRARIFQAQGLKLDLQEIEDLLNPALRAAEMSEKDREKFARVVADYLEQGRKHHRYQRLRLAVEPRLLGRLREHLSRETRELVVEEINGDISKLDAREIQWHLERH